MIWEIFWGLAPGFLLSGGGRAWMPASLVGDKLGAVSPAPLWGRRQGAGHCH